MFYFWQVNTSLVESISNFVFQEEMKVDLDSNERCSTKELFFPWCQKLWKIPTKKFIFSKVEARGLQLY